ncbi:MAG: hypothetical protein ACRDI2_10415 [Chloroflexota bacterium]
MSASPASPSSPAPSPAEAEESTARRCTRHPDRETFVACGRCERPFCPQCLLHTPAGQRCYECAGIRRDAAQRAAAGGFFKAFGVAAIGSGIAGLLGSILFVLLAALITGRVAGQMLSPLVNRRSRRMVYALGLLVLAGGALLGWLVVGLVRTASLPIPLEVRIVALLLAIPQNVTYWLFVAIATVVGYQRVR